MLNFTTVEYDKKLPHREILARTDIKIGVSENDYFLIIMDYFYAPD